MAEYLKLYKTMADYDAESEKVPVSHIIENVKIERYVDPCKSEIIKTTYDWVEIGGIKWATKNIGASSITDHGQYFCWGDANGYTSEQIGQNCYLFSFADYQYGNGTSNPGQTGITKYNSTDGKTVLEAVDDAATVNMGNEWRMPTTNEYQALKNATTSAWTSNYEGSGIAGLILKSKTDSSKKLFFPVTGYYYYNGSMNKFWESSYGYYISSSLHNSSCMACFSLSFSNNYLEWKNPVSRANGYAIRGVHK